MHQQIVPSCQRTRVSTPDDPQQYYYWKVWIQERKYSCVVCGSISQFLGDEHERFVSITCSFWFYHRQTTNAIRKRTKKFLRFKSWQSVCLTCFSCGQADPVLQVLLHLLQDKQEGVGLRSAAEGQGVWRNAIPALRQVDECAHWQSQSWWWRIPGTSWKAEVANSYRRPTWQFSKVMHYADDGGARVWCWTKNAFWKQFRHIR